MRIRFWGTRGSIATPGPGTVRYGGNTSCVELRSARDDLVVIDCGTGARRLGRALASERRETGVPVRGSILLGHTHWDHIQGIPFFEPLFDPDGHWELYGPRGLGASLAETLAGQMQYQYFPVSMEQFGANVEFHDLVEGVLEISGLVVRTQYLNHPALTLGYRIEEDGAAFCYLADHEPFDAALGGGGDVLASDLDRRHVAFMADADVVVHDTQYDAAEYEHRVGWGHSTMEYVVDVACAAGVGQLVLYHHDPERDDAAVDDLLARARDRAAGRIDVIAAGEGDWVDIRSSGGRATPARVHAPAVASPAVEALATAAVVVVRDADIRDRVVAAASSEQLHVFADADAVDALRSDRPAIVVVDVDDETSETALTRLEREAGPAAWSKLTVLGVTRRMRAPSPSAIAVTEWMVWPATTAHVRTKLRAAVLRRACRWLTAPLPPDEEQRLAALRELRVLDTPAEERFDRFTDAVCTSLGVPVALITLVDADRQWFKSRRGVPVDETSRDESVCAHAILGRDVFQVPDLLADPRFADNPAVAGPGRARFYAGAPLVLDDGSRVGTLCAVDHRPRLLDDDQLEELRRLARDVVAELQRRRA